MKKLFLLGVLLVFSIASQAYGYTITDSVDFNDEYLYASGTIAKSWTHDFDLDLSSYTITGATLSISVVDNDVDGQFTDEKIKAYLDSTTIFNPDRDVDTETLSYDFGSNFTLLADNSLSVGLKVYGDLYLANSTLSIFYEDGSVNLDEGGDVSPPAQVHNPIPAPILLLGTGLVGLAGFRRRKSA